MSFDLPDTDMIYIEGIPPGTSEKELAEFFGSIGVIKFDKKQVSYLGLLQHSFAALAGDALRVGAALRTAITRWTLKAGQPSQDKHKIWLYKDKATGQPKGDGTVTYEDPFSAGSAVQWFNNKEFKGA